MRRFNTKRSRLFSLDLFIYYFLDFVAVFLATTFLAGFFATFLTAPELLTAPSAGTEIFDWQFGHLIALPRAASGALSVFSQLGQRTLTGMNRLDPKE